MKAYKTLNDYLESVNLIKGGKYINTKGRRDVSSFPLVTIVTVCRNSEKTIEKTFSAVASQTYTNIEYIVIDGLSTDSTLDMIGRFENFIDFWVSEIDESATDAINKAFNICQGDFIFLLNADDFVGADFIEQAVLSLDDDSDFVFGDCRVGEFGGDYNKVVKGDVNYIKKIPYTMPRINQPTIVFKRECLDIIGLYDLEKKVAPDYDWLVRGYSKNIKGKYSDKLVTFFALDGNSDAFYFKGLQEVRASSLKYSNSVLFTNIYFILRFIKRVLFSYK